MVYGFERAPRSARQANIKPYPPLGGSLFQRPKDPTHLCIQTQYLISVPDLRPDCRRCPLLSRQRIAFLRCTIVKDWRCYVKGVSCMFKCSFLGAFRTLIGAGGPAQCWGRVLIPTVSGAGTHRIRCWYPPYQVLIPTVSGADTCPSHARSQLGTLRPPQRWDSAFCRLRVGRQALWVSASHPVLRAIFASDSPYLLMLLNISQFIPVPQRVVMFRGRPFVLRHLC